MLDHAEPTAPSTDSRRCRCTDCVVGFRNRGEIPIELKLPVLDAAGDRGRLLETMADTI